MTEIDREQELQSRIEQLESELESLRRQMPWSTEGETVRAPDNVQAIFANAQNTVRQYFSQMTTDPTRASIQISGERYVLLRASSLSVGFLKTIKNLYSDLQDDQAFAIGQNFLFDISHVIGMEDARNFHRRMGVEDPIERLSAGPVHFAYSGWAFVDISPESQPQPNEEFFMKYDHPFSFEADSWLRAGERSEHPVCIMNSGYSSGWCAESFGFPLTAVELTCKATGDDSCTFIMAPPHRIEAHLKKYTTEAKYRGKGKHRIPTFFDRKRVEEEMTTARKKAEESDRLKSEFLANMSHEIRTPMNALIGMTQLVLDSQLTNLQRDYLNTTLESAESLMTIINQILDFSKIESGKLDLEIVPFSMSECIGDTMKSLAVRAHSKGLELAWNVTRDVPDALKGDPNRLRQVLVNLIANAIRFTDQGEIVVEVSLVEKSEKLATIHVEVRDTGIGIPEEKVEAIFEAVRQVDMSTTRQYGGTGLGLTISAKLVEMMNGRIWAESEPGLGSTFHFTVTLERDSAPLPRHPELADQWVLVAADHSTNRNILEETLQSLSMRVSTVESARAALHHLLQLEAAGKKLPLLIADTADLLALVEAIRKRPNLNAVPIITLATAVMENDLHKLEGQTVDALLIKPIKQSELIEAIKKARQSPARSVSGRAPGSDAKGGESLGGVARGTGGEPIRPGTSPQSARDDAPPETDEDSGVRILLVEDGLANQKFAVAMLSRWGHSVTIANNGREALEKLNESSGNFDLVLMDVLMPEMDGLQATTAIREKEKTTGAHIPIIAITAQAMKGDREKCLEAGMDEYLSKPIRRKELHQAIQKLLS